MREESLIASHPSCFLFAGEASGDLHGSHLMRALREQNSAISFYGVGGNKMHAEGLQSLLPMSEFAVMGFSDVIRCFPRLFRNFYSVRDAILKLQPDIVILIDHADFNLRMAKALRRQNFSGRIVHYISPSVWAWRKGRVKTMAKTLDLLLTIYPFEAAHFADSKLPVKFVGNPLKEYLSKHAYDPDWKAELAISDEAPIIALFPGSRKGEIARNLPIQLKVAEMMLKCHPNRVFALSAMTGEEHDILLHYLQKSQLCIGKNFFFVPREYNYELMRDCHSAIAKSGTVTLELALHSRPTVVMYCMTKLNRFIAKYIARINLPYYCIVNILAEEQLFPEFIEQSATTDLLLAKLRQIDLPGPQRNRCIEGCKKLQATLGENRASSRAAAAILEILK